MPNPKEKVDHVAEARRAVDRAARTPSPEDVGWAAVGQVHASLAIAEQLEDQNHWLEEIANQLSRAQS